MTTQSDRLLRSAKQLYARGMAVVPISGSGDGKHPPLDGWQTRRLDWAELEQAITRGHITGIGVVTGQLSNNLVDLDFDGDGWQPVLDHVLESWPELATTARYHSGSGRPHVWLRCPDMPPDFTIAVYKRPDLDCHIELRGNGHQTLCPPSLHKKSGKYYRWAVGEADLVEVPFADLHAWLDAWAPEIAEDVTQTRKPATTPGGRPGDEFNQQADWAALLTGWGWTLAKERRGMGYWVRPGKDARDGHSATLNYGDRGKLYVFSADAAPFEANHSYSPFEAYALMEHGGDFGAAAAALRAQGFGASEEGKPWTDVANGKRFIAQHGENLRYCEALGGWLVWDGQRWMPDITGQVARMAKATARTIYAEADACENDERRQALSKWAVASESANRQQAMISMAWSEPGIAVQATDFDANPWLLNCANGTLDLRSGRLHVHDRADMLTKLVPVNYDPAATHPILDSYLFDATGGDAEFAAYLQRAVGYSLTGVTSEECFFMVLGPAATGKTTLIEALLAMMGDYGMKSSFDAFLEHNNSGGPTPELARLRGARLVAASETSRTRRLNEVAVKELTGGDLVTARHLHREPITFKPVLKLWLAANEAPKLTDTDTGLWRRLHRLPFEHELAADKRDPFVKESLTSDALPALLAWAVQGCLDWQRVGLRQPAAVRTATAALRAEFDPLAEFFADRCVFAPSAETGVGSLRQAYEQWANDMGARPINNKDWGQRLRAKGCEQENRRNKSGRARIWRGVGLLTMEQTERTEANFDFFAREKSMDGKTQNSLVSVPSVPPDIPETEMPF